MEEDIKRMVVWQSRALRGFWAKHKWINILQTQIDRKKNLKAALLPRE